MERGNKSVSIPQQSICIRSKFGGQTFIKNNNLKWVGYLQPTIISNKYKVELKYRLGNNPKVILLDPKIEKEKGTVPHVYNDGSLCLYYPKDRDWHAGRLLCKTVIPWICEWLYFYEIWKVTGSWNGGGIEHESSKG